MNILINIAHPAHVHQFKETIKKLSLSNRIIILSNNKDVSNSLLDYYNFQYLVLPNYRNSILGKIFGMILSIFIISKIVKRYNIDLLVGRANIPFSLISKLSSKPYIFFSDTESAVINNKIASLFKGTAVTPSCFGLNLKSSHHIKYDGYHELAYLLPSRFSPDKSVLKELGVKETEKYILMRFVSWGASHDIGQSGFSDNDKFKIVKELSNYAKVFISSEKKLPSKLESYRINISPEKIHDILSFASLYIGEGATMASEAAVLGVPTIYVNSLYPETIKEQEKYGLIVSYRSSEGVLEKALNLLNTPNLKQKYRSFQKKMLDDKIDVTEFITWFIENYPESIKIIQSNNEYQNRFRINAGMLDNSQT